jgi:formylglycine-generating enzyme required for sulfatase activity
MPAPRVLISYSHDSPAHAARVLNLADDLRANGVDAQLDQYTPAPRLGWPSWMREQVEAAQFIVCVCTPTYRQRFEQRAPPGEGLGASWEGWLAELAIYGDRDRRGAFIPVLLDAATPDHVPTVLRGQTRHHLPNQFEALLRQLLDRPATPMPPLGPQPKLPPRSPGLRAPPTAQDQHDALTHALAQAMARQAPHDELSTLRTQLRAHQAPGNDLHPGDTLGERLYLKRRLGQGGIASVWSAVQPLTRSRVRELAVKVLHQQHHENQSVITAFRKGAADQAQLDDPDIVRVFEPWVEADGRYWMVMELLPGGDLGQAVHDKLIDPALAVQHCLRIGHTLARLHDRQLIHADLKPANLLLDAHGAPKLADFDLAKNLALSEVRGTRHFGDAQFCCQEQLDGDPVTPAWDIYALSATALWCASGGTLTKKQLRTGNLPDLPIPPAAVTALRHGAATEPEDRTPTMAAWCAALEAGLRAPTPGPPPPRPSAPTTAPPPPANPNPSEGRTAHATVAAAPTTVAAAPTTPRPVPTAPAAAERRIAQDTVAAAPPRTVGERLRFELPGSVPLHLAYIPAGTFWMGSPDGVGDSDERPRHQVTLTRPYWMGVTPVTQAQWAAVARATKNLNPDPSHFKGPDRPVETVSWDDARAWCNALSSALGLAPAYPQLHEPASIDWTQGFRLPTEAEWERACRAGTDTAWSFGDEEQRLGEHGWFEGNAGGETHPVAQLKPNPWGLYDLHGNVWEWCWDEWGRTYTSAPVTDPTTPPTGRGFRHLRGGAFLYSADWCRSAYRGGGGSGVASVGRGFRVVLPAPARGP